MLLHKLRTCAERELASGPCDSVAIAVPLHFSAARRQAVLDAAAIAGLKGVRLLSDGAAAAIDYALGRPDLPTDTDLHVAFVDAGHAGVQVCVVALRKDSLRVLSHAYAADAGGAVRASAKRNAAHRLAAARWRLLLLCVCAPSALRHALLRARAPARPPAAHDDAT